MVEKLTEKDRPLRKSEHFDHVNECEPKTVNWIEGNAYCPECGEMGVVYDKHVWERGRK